MVWSLATQDWYMGATQRYPCEISRTLPLMSTSHQIWRVRITQNQVIAGLGASDLHGKSLAEAIFQPSDPCHRLGESFKVTSVLTSVISSFQGLQYSIAVSPPLTSIHGIPGLLHPLRPTYHFTDLKLRSRNIKAQAGNLSGRTRLEPRVSDSY